MNKTILVTGFSLGLLAVVLGAFGAHGLSDLISERSLQAYKTGVEYQMYHALLLLLVGNMQILGAKLKKRVFITLLAAIICFSFSLYAIALGELWGMELGGLGWLTPIGGLLFIISWLTLAYRVIRPLN